LPSEESHMRYKLSRKLLSVWRWKRAIGEIPEMRGGFFNQGPSGVGPLDQRGSVDRCVIPAIRGEKKITHRNSRLTGVLSRTDTSQADKRKVFCSPRGLTPWKGKKFSEKRGSILKFLTTEGDLIENCESGKKATKVLVSKASEFLFNSEKNGRSHHGCRAQKSLFRPNLPSQDGLTLAY